MQVNGIKRQSLGSTEGFYGVVNLLAPRAAGQSGAWRSDATWVDLRYEFVRPPEERDDQAVSLSGSPIALERTFVTFCARSVSVCGAVVCSLCVRDTVCVTIRSVRLYVALCACGVLA